MEHYIYCADVYCQACGESIRERIAREGHAPAHPDDEHTYDSDEYPKGPFSGEERDSPGHCGSGPDCADALTLKDGSKVGAFLGEPLTSEGERSVREMHRDSRSEITEMWMTFYGLHRHCEWCDVPIDVARDGRLCDQCRNERE